MTDPPTTLVDSNVLIDLALDDPAWARWSRQALAGARARARVAVNPIICAELSPAYATASDLEDALPAADFLRLDLPFEAAWLAGHAFVRYRRAGGRGRSPLPDFYIGAHAQVAGRSSSRATPRGTGPTSLVSSPSLRIRRDVTGVRVAFGAGPADAEPAPR